MTSGLSGIRGIAIKTAVSGATSAAKEVSSQFKDGAESFKDINYKKVKKEALIGSAVTGSSGALSHGLKAVRFRGVEARPSSSTPKHWRAGQKRYSKSTMRNARRRLQKRKESFLDKAEAYSSAFFNSLVSYGKRLGVFN